MRLESEKHREGQKSQELVDGGGQGRTSLSEDERSTRSTVLKVRAFMEFRRKEFCLDTAIPFTKASTTWTKWKVGEWEDQKEPLVRLKNQSGHKRWGCAPQPPSFPPWPLQACAPQRMSAFLLHHHLSFPHPNASEEGIPLEAASLPKVQLWPSET